MPKIQEEFIVNKSPRALFSVIENRVCFGRRIKTIIKITLKLYWPEKIFQKLFLKIALFLHMHRTV